MPPETQRMFQIAEISRYLLIFVQAWTFITLLRTGAWLIFPAFSAWTLASALHRLDFQPLNSHWWHVSWVSTMPILLILIALACVEAGYQATSSFAEGGQIRRAATLATAIPFLGICGESWWIQVLSMRQSALIGLSVAMAILAGYVISQGS